MTGADRPPAGEDVLPAVVSRYSALARAARAGQQVTDCEPGAFEEGGFGAAGYADVSGLPGGAVRASLGCGNPVAVADLRPGDTVLDLGSGGGIDVLLSARRVAPGGRAYGLDASADMIALARENAERAGVGNAEFLLGRIEEIPLPDGDVDVVISNCVVNLSGDKPRVLAEAFRVLRPGGRLGISDMIAEDGIAVQQRAGAEQEAGCVTGTVTAREYRDQLLAAGFTGITIRPAGDPDAVVRPAIIQALRPAAPPGVMIRPMQPALTGTRCSRYTRRGWTPATRASRPARLTGTASTGPGCAYTGGSRSARTASSSAGPQPRRSRTGAPTPGWWSTRYTWRRPRTAAASALRCSPPWLARRKRPGSGPSRPGSSPRTQGASPCTSGPGSASSARVAGLAATTAPGATCSCWNGAAPPPELADLGRLHPLPG